jgi:hypothetical protein
VNERIRELAKQAGAGEWGDSIVPAMMDVEKFAELLIQECCNAADDWYQNANDIHWDPAQHIRNHFGVE